MLPRARVVLAALLIAACGDTSSTASPRDDTPSWLGDTDPGRPIEGLADPAGQPSVPWAPGDGPTTTVRGRVVTPEGEPVAGAQVQLIYGGDPHYGEALAYEGRSGEDGRFVFEGLSAHVMFDIVVRHGDAVRTFTPPIASAEVARREPVEIRIAPTREVPFTVHCRETPRAPRSSIDTYVMEASVRWLPVEDLVTRTALASTDGTPDSLSGRGEPGQSTLRPGRVVTLPRVPLDARSFATTLTLPLGSHRVTVTGPCGLAWREIDVTEGEGLMPAVDMELPVSDHSELVLMLSPSSSRPRVFPVVSVGGTRLRHPYELRRQPPIRIERVAPGAYDVGGVSCHEPIDVPPNSVVGVTIGPEGCVVRSRAR